MDVEFLSAAMGGALPLERYAQLLPVFEKALRLADAESKPRRAMFMAQIGHESDGLRAREEYASGAEYEGRVDLGNVHPGDGERFKGRGWIQVTGRSNYAACSRWAFEQGVVDSPDYFVQHPEKLADDEFVWVGPVWYWTVARPGLNGAADRGDIKSCTRMINGGLTNLDDRVARYHRVLNLINAASGPCEKVLDQYVVAELHQDRPYYCGPGATQTVISVLGKEFPSEDSLAKELGTTVAGTDAITAFPAVLNRHCPGAGYVAVEMPNDPPLFDEREKLWDDLVSSIDAGYGVVANIVAPESNYPRMVAPSSGQFHYSGGTVYHYVAIMGYAQDPDGSRRVWWVDSGFRPFVGWVSFDQLATLIPEKGYAYATAGVKEGEISVSEADRIIKHIEDFVAGFTGPIGVDVKDVREQLCGQGSRDTTQYSGFADLGKDDKGNNLLPRQALAAIRWDIASLRGEVAELAKKVGA